MSRANLNGQAHTASSGYLVALLSAATFIVFFQAYMVAPLIPRLSHYFSVPENRQ